MATTDGPDHKGLGKRPKDFDAFWKAGKAEVDALGSAHELELAAFQAPFAECWHLTFTGVGGARVHAKFLRPRGQRKPGPALLCFHGYTVDSGHWQDKLGYVAAGFTVALLDCRGQAGRSQDLGGVEQGYTMSGLLMRGMHGPAEGLYFRQVYLDTYQLARIVMAMRSVDPGRVGCMGGSQGGGLSLVCAGLEPRIKRVACSYPFLSDFEWVYRHEILAGPYVEIMEYFRRFDPLHQREAEVFRKLAYVDVRHFAALAKGELLMGLAMQDKVCPPATQTAAFNHFAGRKQARVYPDMGHDELPGFADETFGFLGQL